MRLLAVCARQPAETRRQLVDLGVLDLIVSMTPGSQRYPPGFACDLMSALANLAPACGEEEKNAVVRSPAMKEIYRLSRSGGHAARRGAKDVLRALGQEASAFLVQMMLLRFVNRMKSSEFRERRLEERLTKSALRKAEDDLTCAAEEENADRILSGLL